MPSNEATLRNLREAGEAAWNRQPSQMVRDAANRCWRDPATGSCITDREVYASRTLPGLPWPEQPAPPKRQPMQSWQRLELQRKHRHKRWDISVVRFYRRHRAALASLLMAAAVLLAGLLLR